MKLKVVFFCLLALIVTSSVYAQEGYDLSLKGLALVTLKSRRLNLEVEQAIVVKNQMAAFVGLDDFGGESFRLIFTPAGMTIVAGGQAMQTSGKKLKKIISLPLSQKEFLDIVAYQMQGGFTVKKENEKTYWTRDKKKVVVEFSQFKKMGKRGRFPWRVFIRHKKNSLKLDWMNLKIEWPKRKYKPLPQ